MEDANMNGAPEAASEEAPKTKWVWRCKVCGYIIDGYEDGLPESFTCPICGNGPKKFKRVEVPIDTLSGTQLK